jgi:hypothetical protein
LTTYYQGMFFYVVACVKPSRLEASRNDRPLY